MLHPQNNEGVLGKGTQKALEGLGVQKLLLDTQALILLFSVYTYILYFYIQLIYFNFSEIKKPAQNSTAYTGVILVLTCMS